MYIKFIKQGFDFLFSLIGLIIVSPILFCVIIILTLSLNGSPFFVQLRPGKNKKIFKLIKLKTMNDQKDHLGNLLPDSDRLTTIGAFIRKTSIDELPQLVNVLKGEMSIVGPRPLLVEYLPLYSVDQAKRHKVKPGMTGWAQINGRNNISWSKKFELDCWYVKNCSFFLDLKILFRTILKVFKSEGVIKDGFTTTEYFNGNN